MAAFVRLNYTGQRSLAPTIIWPRAGERLVPFVVSVSSTVTRETDMEPSKTLINTPILNTMTFRLLFGTQDDRYESENAPYVVAAIASLDDESARVTVRLAGLEAEWGLG